MKPRIGIIPGDPGGIGPELIAKLLAEPETQARGAILLIGDAHVFELGQRQAGIAHVLHQVDPRAGDWTMATAGAEGFAHLPHDTIGPEDVAIGAVSGASGRSTLQNLDLALDLVAEGVIDAIVFGPFNKAAMHLAGIGHADELHYVAARQGVEGYISELNTLDGIWTSRVTSHIPLRAVADVIDGDRITEAVMLIERTLRRSGIRRPRISVAALNPHAGDNGNFGREEIDVIRPAVETIAARQLAVDGPWPSDTVFLKAQRREIDGIVTMYHDQGQIALKLMGFDRGVTVQGGLPFPMTTPAHGTAFDIAGQGVADLGAMRAAFDIACDMVQHWSAAA
ncbi:MAG: 4-hydroxythreonine-4-phosphate dehydrogenase PdxA [Pseudomonadota bacterium]